MAAAKINKRMVAQLIAERLKSQIDDLGVVDVRYLGESSTQEPPTQTAWVEFVALDFSYVRIARHSSAPDEVNFTLALTVGVPDGGLTPVDGLLLETVTSQVRNALQDAHLTDSAGEHTVQIDEGEDREDPPAPGNDDPQARSCGMTFTGKVWRTSGVSVGQV